MLIICCPQKRMFLHQHVVYLCFKGISKSILQRRASAEGDFSFNKIYIFATWKYFKRACLKYRGMFKHQNVADSLWQKFVMLNVRHCACLLVDDLKNVWFSVLVDEFCFLNFYSNVILLACVHCIIKIKLLPCILSIALYFV